MIAIIGRCRARRYDAREPTGQEARMKSLRIAATALVIAAAGGAAGAQTPPAGSAMPMHHPMGGMQGMHGMHGMVMHHAGQQAGIPTAPGQAAFGAIQEVVEMLQSNPRTDWTKVDVDALREHLIDMNEVTMRAAARKEPIDGGLRIVVTGSGRILEAIRRMVPAHAQDIDGMNGWAVRTRDIPNGVELTVTAASPAEAQKIRALGFMGLMAQGSHHQPHHLAIAKGEPMHLQ
jgi:hypothetical protein